MAKHESHFIRWSDGCITRVYREKNDKGVLSSYVSEQTFTPEESQELYTAIQNTKVTGDVKPYAK